MDVNSYDINYMPTKKQSFIGLQLGAAEQARQLKYNIQESMKIRANCKNYQKILKKNHTIVKIENIVNGRIDAIYLAYYEDDYRYLFPYMKSKDPYPTYLSVTHFMEEYMVQSDQIVYRKYGKPRNNKIDYYYINYVPQGKYPVIEELQGFYVADTFELKEEKHNVWFHEHR